MLGKCSRTDKSVAVFSVAVHIIILYCRSRDFGGASQRAAIRGRFDTLEYNINLCRSEMVN